MTGTNSQMFEKFQLDIEDTKPEEAARKILELMEDVPRGYHG